MMEVLTPTEDEDDDETYTSSDLSHFLMTHRTTTPTPLSEAGDEDDDADDAHGRQPPPPSAASSVKHAAAAAASAEKRVTFDADAYMCVSTTEMESERSATTLSETAIPRSMTQDDSDAPESVASTTPHLTAAQSSPLLMNPPHQSEDELKMFDHNALTSHSTKTLLSKSDYRTIVTLNMLPRSKSAVENTKTECLQKNARKVKKSKRRTHRRLTLTKSAYEDAAIAWEHQEQGGAKKMKRIKMKRIKKKRTKKLRGGRPSRILVEADKQQLRADLEQGAKDSNKSVQENRESDLEDQTSTLMNNFKVTSVPKSKTGTQKQVSWKRKRRKRSPTTMPVKMATAFEKLVARAETKGDVSARLARFHFSKRPRSKNTLLLRSAKYAQAKPKSAVSHSEQKTPSHSPGTVLTTSSSSPNLDTRVKTSLSDKSRRINAKFANIIKNIISSRNLRTQSKSKDEDKQSDAEGCNMSFPDLLDLADRQRAQEKLCVLSLLKSEDTLRDSPEEVETASCLHAFVAEVVEEENSTASRGYDSSAAKKTLVENMPLPATPKKTLQAIVQAAAVEGNRRTASGGTSFQVAVPHRVCPAEEKADMKTRLQQSASARKRCGSAHMTPVRSSHANTSIHTESSVVKVTHVDLASMSSHLNVVQATSSKHRFLTGKAQVSTCTASPKHGPVQSGGLRGSLSSSYHVFGNKISTKEIPTKRLLAKKAAATEHERPQTENSVLWRTSGTERDGWPLRSGRIVANQPWGKQTATKKVARAHTAGCVEGSRSTTRTMGLESSADELQT